MTYEQTVKYLFSCLPMYQREGKAAYKTDIGNILAASRKLGNPHESFKSIHVAGTNGKGSLCHMLASILYESGYKVGLYTSPHIKDFRERIKINGEMISETEVIEFVSENKDTFEKAGLSFFEFTVALTFSYFAKKKVDIAIIETGLGGRLDSTNIIIPILSIITNIGLDHTDLLGNTIEKIALEKAGIIKKNVPVIIGKEQNSVKKIFEKIAKNANTRIKYSSHQNYISDLKGDYQKENINTCVSAIKQLQKQKWKINELDIKNGLLNTIKNTGLKGRWQLIGKDPIIICDTGHNQDALRIIFNQIKSISYKNLHIVFGLVNDKDTNAILDILPKNAKYYFCKPNIRRGLDENILQLLASKKEINGKSHISVKKALLAAKKAAESRDLIFVGGSTFVVAEVI